MNREEAARLLFDKPNDGCRCPSPFALLEHGLNGVAPAACDVHPPEPADDLPLGIAEVQAALPLNATANTLAAHMGIPTNQGESR